MSAWVASLCGGGAVALLVPWRPALDRGRLAGAPLLLAPAAAVVVLLAPAQVAALALVAALGLAAGVLVWRRRARQRRVARTAAAMVEVCEQLAAELASGQPPGTALDRAAGEWVVLEPVAEAFRIGSDVPAALRRAAAWPGAADLSQVAAAWQVAQRTGQGLAAALDRVALDLRAAQATQRVVEGELASARATAKLVALLPVAALTMGSGVGGDPWGFLLGTPVGLGCLGAGLALGFAGLWWIEQIAGAVDRER